MSRTVTHSSRPVVPPSIRYALRLESTFGLERAAGYLASVKRPKLRPVKLRALRSVRLPDGDPRAEAVGRLVYGVRTVCRRELGGRWWKKCRTIEDLRAVVVPGLLAGEG